MHMASAHRVTGAVVLRICCRKSRLPFVCRGFKGFRFRLQDKGWLSALALVADTQGGLTLGLEEGGLAVDLPCLGARRIISSAAKEFGTRHPPFTVQVCLLCQVDFRSRICLLHVCHS
jgi:hypothetical protein